MKIPLGVGWGDIRVGGIMKINLVWGGCDFRGISLSIMFFLCVGKITSSSKLETFLSILITHKSFQ